MSGRDLYYRLNPTAHPNAWDAHDPDVRARYDAEALRAAVEVDDDASDRHYLAGSRAAWRSILSLASRELEGPDLKLAGALAQLHDVRAALQQACEGRVKVNDWNLHLADVVSKYLVPYIAEREDIEGEPMRAALESFVDTFEDITVDGLADLNEAYEMACAALGREPAEINP